MDGIEPHYNDLSYGHVYTDDNRQHPGPIAINNQTHIIYIGYLESGTVSTIKVSTDEVAVGVIFNVNPSGGRNRM